MLAQAAGTSTLLSRCRTCLGPGAVHARWVRPAVSGSRGAALPSVLTNAPAPLPVRPTARGGRALSRGARQLTAHVAPAEAAAGGQPERAADEAHGQVRCLQISGCDAASLPWASNCAAAPDRARAMLHTAHDQRALFKSVPKSHPSAAAAQLSRNRLAQRSEGPVHCRRSCWHAACSSSSADLRQGGRVQQLQGQPRAAQVG